MRARYSLPFAALRSRRPMYAPLPVVGIDSKLTRTEASTSLRLVPSSARRSSPRPIETRPTDPPTEKATASSSAYGPPSSALPQLPDRVRLKVSSATAAWAPSVGGGDAATAAMHAHATNPAATTLCEVRRRRIEAPLTLTR
jgi:hypothetical protein